MTRQRTCDAIRFHAEMLERWGLYADGLFTSGDISIVEFVAKTWAEGFSNM